MRTFAGCLSFVVLAACGGDGGGTLVVSTKFVLAEQSGMGPSPLDELLGEEIAFEVELDAAVASYDTVDACKWTVETTASPVATASGVHAELVQSFVLDRLPMWDLRLALCDDPKSSSVTLHSDNNYGLAVIAGCLVPAPSVQVHDGNGHPKWTDFDAMNCDGSVYDQTNARLFTGRGFTMTFSHR